MLIRRPGPPRNTDTVSGWFRSGATHAFLLPLPLRVIRLWISGCDMSALLFISGRRVR
ncbi:hypothetical protein CU044_0601 [Streptomyces sp. L-9-10]|nr:hypothetical protein CU044_0601 [Streptomyces sp. L-9-10]